MVRRRARLVMVCLALCCLPVSLGAEGDGIGDLIQQERKESAPAKPTPPPLIIVIDPGHGGKDTGAIGYKKMREKDIVLQISRRLAKNLKSKLGAQVVLTRSQDRFITLDNRDHIAVRKKADLFISIHANAAKRKGAAGIEIYYLNNATDEAAKRLAARENRGSLKSLSELQAILNTMIQNESTTLSALLAEQIKKAIQSKVANKYPLDRLKIRSALFYVLVGSKAPSILLETGFITNPKEAKRLASAAYQNKLVHAVTTGVANYLKVLESQKINL